MSDPLHDAGHSPPPAGARNEAQGVTREYTNAAITVRWRAALCIHSARCARTLPAVFDPQRHPWVVVDAAAATDIAATVRQCPSGALTYLRHDGGDHEKPDVPTTLVPMRHGPTYARGDLEWHLPGGGAVSRETRLALCRCGLSTRVPLCDNSCRAEGWREP
jgi:uncharacterized Fe-S cluster protein YjdI